MKTKQLLTAVIAVLCICNHALAQHNKTASPLAFQRAFTRLDLPNSSPGIFNSKATASVDYNEEKYRRFKKMRTAGIVLTSVGAGLIIGGTALIIDGENENDGYHFDGDYYYGDLSDGDSKIIAGAVGIVFGALSTGGGITMWVIGNNKMKKYGGGQMSLQPAKNGLSLAYRF